MTGPDPLEELERRSRAEAFPSSNPVMDAVDAYRARFGDTPWMIHVPEDRMPAWLDAIREATRTGKRLSEVNMQRVVGFGYPPPGTSS